MVLAKSKNSVGLGQSLMNDRFGKGKASNMKKASHNAGIARKDMNGETYITNSAKEASWVKMRSITEQAALDEFLTTAELAGTDFTAEKMNNVQIIHTDQKNPYLLSAAEEKSAIRKHKKNKGRLTVPRRPHWDKTTTRNELDTMERESFMDWRRGLAELQENNDLLMTPFERNLEVWRQLWRVVERSDIVVQIVDARNPLLFRSEDLELYVKELNPKKRNLLLVNKADMLTEKQREMWADYFVRHQIDFRFFSAQLAKEANEAREKESEDDSDAEETESLAEETEELKIQDSGEKEADGGVELASQSVSPKRTNILDVDELEELFLSNAPDAVEEEDDDGEPKSPRKTIIGLVGYPNVGKSSTINALLGAKKVSVSSTPGKTKHFQTLYLSPEIMLCDCPGLVFPNFASTKAELVVNGVLPIDQQREFTGPAGLVAQRIPKHFLEDVYGITIRTRPLEEGGTGVPTAHDILRAYARARGFATTGQGQPDESRAARYVLKDYVNGKLLFCHPPPATISESDPDADPEDSIDAAEFNKDLYDWAHLPPRRQAMLAAAALNQSSKTPVQGLKSQNVDKGFFGPGGDSSGGRLTMPFNSKYTEQGQEIRKPLSGRKERIMVALERGVDVSEVKGSSKKHFKVKHKNQKKGKNLSGGDDY
ncbi:P-loop containing nucleoside triphosphate hydrolase protein [Aspergillus karnatakaensis]|uniref:ribosome biogenesis GTPase LSG1 n=1 Tax=Aspergillus karnatakaensis TaxID=1810916 RepID=UPI003CCCDC4D